METSPGGAMNKNSVTQRGKALRDQLRVLSRQTASGVVASATISTALEVVRIRSTSTVTPSKDKLIRTICRRLNKYLKIESEMARPISRHNDDYSYNIIIS